MGDDVGVGVGVNVGAGVGVDVTVLPVVCVDVGEAAIGSEKAAGVPTVAFVALLASEGEVGSSARGIGRACGLSSDDMVPASAKDGSSAPPNRLRNKAAMMSANPSVDVDMSNFKTDCLQLSLHVGLSRSHGSDKSKQTRVVGLSESLGVSSTRVNGANVPIRVRFWR